MNLFNLDEEKMSVVVSGFQVPVKPGILSSIDKLMAKKEPDIEEVASLTAASLEIRKL